MPTSLLVTIKDLASELRPADVLDIVVVSMLIHAAFSWLRRAQSRFVVAGLCGVALLYVAARLLGMHLTLYIFQAVLTVAVVAVAVIFQEDIRRGFERLAVASPLAPFRATGGTEPVVRMLSKAMVKLAARRVGALVVLKGREPLERHLTGGLTLHGRLSEELVLSIFDPNSPGHDGAVILGGGQVERFGVHLPLSTSEKNGSRGTRHSAALGLSERSDALVVVVSEERGTISVASRGALREVTPQELERELWSFRQATDLVRPSRRNHWLRSAGTRFLSLAVAAAAFVVVERYQTETVARTLSVPIVYRETLADWLFEPPEPAEVRVAVSGPVRAFQTITPERLRAALTIDKPKEGKQEVPVDQSALNLPPEVTVQFIEPRTVTIEAHRSAEITLPIRAQIAGHVPAGSVLGAVTVRPAEATVIVRRADRPSYVALKTDPVDVSDIDHSVTISRDVDLPSEVRPERPGPIKVEVSIEVAPARAPPPPAAAPKHR